MFSEYINSLLNNILFIFGFVLSYLTHFFITPFAGVVDVE